MLHIAWRHAQIVCNKIMIISSVKPNGFGKSIKRFIVNPKMHMKIVRKDTEQNSEQNHSLEL